MAASAAPSSGSVVLMAEPLELDSPCHKAPPQQAPPDTPVFGRRPSGSRPKESLHLEKGSQVDFYSVSKRCWISCTVLLVDPKTGAVRLDVKPSKFLDTHEQMLRLRPHTGQADGNSEVAQLQRMRTALGEGPLLREEAHAIFARYAEVDHAAAGAEAGPQVRLQPSAAEALGEELDARLGVSGCTDELRRHFQQARGNGLSTEDFCEVLRELLWGKPQVDAAVPGSDLATTLRNVAREEAGASAAQQGFLEQVRGFATWAWEVVTRATARGAPAEPSEEDLRQLAEMGFSDRERCIEALRRHGNRLNPRVFDELLAARESSGTQAEDEASSAAQQGAASTSAGASSSDDHGR